MSAAIEDYLKAVYDLGGAGVKTQDLADALGISAASVSGMLKKLGELNLVTTERYRGTSLTAAGQRVALETLRHHRLIETYLAEALGYDWHDVHDEAERLEHVISEDFEARIAELLGHPRFDPHGDPIPGPDGSLPESGGVPLSELPVGLLARLTRITDQRREVLVYLAAQGLRPGAAVTVAAHAPFDGPVTVAANGREVALALDLAASLYAAAVTDTPENDTSKVDTSKVDTSRVDTSRVDTSKVDTSKVDKPENDAPELDTSAPPS